MKKGLRSPNIKKSVRARTTGKINRSVKRAINPTYGKKGMGMIKNPQKAIYNKIYNKTTFSVKDIHHSSNTTNSSSDIYSHFSQNANSETFKNPTDEVYTLTENTVIFGKKAFNEKQLKNYSLLYLLVGIFLIISGLATLPIGLLLFVFGIILVYVSRIYSSARRKLLTYNSKEKKK